MVMLSSGQHLKAPWPNRCCGVRFELAPVKGIGLAPSIGARRATKVVPLLQTEFVVLSSLCMQSCFGGALFSPLKSPVKHVFLHTRALLLFHA